MIRLFNATARLIGLSNDDKQASKTFPKPVLSIFLAVVALLTMSVKFAEYIHSPDAPSSTDDYLEIKQLQSSKLHIGIDEMTSFEEDKRALPGGHQLRDHDFWQDPIQINRVGDDSLYLDCLNEMEVLFPSLGDDYDPAFRVKGANIIRYPKVGKIAVIPKSGQLQLEVYHKGKFIGAKTFQAKPIPSPTIVPMVGVKRVDPKAGIPLHTEKLRIVVLPEEAFKISHPKDARFRVSKAVVYLMRAGKSIRKMQVSNPNVNLKPLTQDAQKGDMLKVEVLEVLRANYKAQILPFNNIDPYSKLIMIPLR